MLRIDFLQSQVWQALSAPERAVYIQLASRYNGSNNGRITFSVREAARECRLAIGTARAALAELTERGFIELRMKGAFSLKLRHASEWLLTDYRDSFTGEPPRRLYLKPEFQKPVPN